jgi:hypothetical protein
MRSLGVGEIERVGKREMDVDVSLRLRVLECVGD